MECVRWSNGRLVPAEEENVYDQPAVNLYALEDKTGFQLGKLQLTSHRLIWHDQHDGQCKLEINLAQIKSNELRQAAAGQGRTQAKQQQVFSRIVLVLEKNNDYPAESYVMGHKMPAASGAYIQFEFEYGGHNEFQHQLSQQLTRKHWTRGKAGQVNAMSSQMHNVGITGIQRKIQERLDQQDAKINDSFKDLSILMNQAKEMVELSNSIIAKINKETAKEVTADEDTEDMKNLKSYFLNMGLIDNPVTKESSGSKYYKDLAMEIYKSMTRVVAENGCIMTMADVYCRLNRARGIAGLISSEDLLYACKELNKLNKELRYCVYAELNLHVLEIQNSEANERKLKEVVELVKRSECLTAYGLSRELNCSLNVAKKYLIDGERVGKLCRDDTNMGLKFYINLFV
jgi:hypothetical protein